MDGNPAFDFIYLFIYLSIYFLDQGLRFMWHKGQQLACKLLKRDSF